MYLNQIIGNCRLWVSKDTSKFWTDPDVGHGCWIRDLFFPNFSKFSGVCEGLNSMSAFWLFSFFAYKLLILMVF